MAEKRLLNGNTKDNIAEEKDKGFGKFTSVANKAKAGMISNEKGGAPRSNANNRRAVGNNRSLQLPRG